MSRRTEPMETYPSNTKINPIPPLASHAGTRRGKPAPQATAATNRTHRGTAQHRRTSARTKRQTELQAADAGTPGTKYRDRSRGCEIMEGGGKAPVHPEEREAAERRDNGGKSIPECEYRRRQSRGYE